MVGHHTSLVMVGNLKRFPSSRQRRLDVSDSNPESAKELLIAL